jgi:hypothetical protein
MLVETWSDYRCEVSAGLFKFVPSYIARIDELTSWSDRKNIMRTAFLQFCTANKKHFLPTMFSHDKNIGMFPVDIKVVAAFLSYLRYKGGDVAPPQPKKLSTIHTNWQEVKQGLVTEFAHETTKPEWLLCLRRRPLHGKFLEPAHLNYVFFVQLPGWVQANIIQGSGSWILEP